MPAPAITRISALLVLALACGLAQAKVVTKDIAYEQGRAPQPLLDALNAMGHGVAARDPIGDVHAILFDGGKLVAVADPRAGGAAGGY